MTGRASEAAAELRLERSFAAPREQVFEAWTNPEVLRRWWAAGPDWDCPLAEVEVRVDGGYRLSMHDPESDQTYTVTGTYIEVRPPERLAFTWTWEAQGEDSPSAGSLVTVDFLDEGGATKVVLTHSGIGSEESRRQHEEGWRPALENLERRIFGSDG